MIGELVIRFILGGVIVSIFAIIGEVFQPKTFAGIFGAAPSVALASPGLTFLTKSMQHASLDGRSMVCGAIGLACYSLLVARLLLRFKWNTIVATVSSWVVWLAVAFGLWAAFLR